MSEDMQKTTIILPEGLYERVKRLAAERGESMTVFIRDALVTATYASQPMPRSLGVGYSGRSDISERIDELYDPEL